MNFVNVQSITERVLEVMAQTPDDRLREVSMALVKHLHAFIREVQPTADEFERGCAFVVGLGQATSQAKNEVILASDILGASSLINLIQDQSGGTSGGGGAGVGAGVGAEGKTDSALLGPFWRKSAPEFELGASIARGEEAFAPGQALWVSGRVRDEQGRALAGAVVDVWQASPVGLYENQDQRQPDMNLRGRFRTDPQGRFDFRSVRPAGYPVPVDGPCGELLRGQNRRPFRPAHLHFMVSHPGYEVLVTQVFADDDEHLETDVTFSVVESLVGRFAPVEKANERGFALHYDFVLRPGELRLPTPPIP
jgi:catechol 1,2-dioxygenase